MKLNERWTRNLFLNLEESLSQEDLEKILLKCGRQCISESLKKKARCLRRKAKTDREIILALSKIWPALRLEGKKIQVIYPKCYCYIAGKFPGTLPKSYCNCSRGWIMELFEQALGKPVKVKIIDTVKRGGTECRFNIVL